MSNALIIILIVLLILALAIRQIINKKNIEAELKEADKLSEVQLLNELDRVNFVLWALFAGGILLTVNYAITYFSGSDLRYIENWDLMNYLGAGMGIVVTIGITFTQRVLYERVTNHTSAVFATVLILIFVIYSEVSSPLEKEDLKVRERSENSLVYQNTVSAIGSGTTFDAGKNYKDDLAAAAALKAKHEFELTRCNRHESKGPERVQRCADYENRKINEAIAQIAAIESLIKQASENNQSTNTQLIEKSQELAFDEKNHSAVVRFFMKVTGSSSEEVAVLAAIFLVVAFEVAFHFVGSRYGLLREALMRKGNKDLIIQAQLKSHQRHVSSQLKNDKITAQLKRLSAKTKPQTVTAPESAKADSPAPSNATTTPDSEKPKQSKTSKPYSSPLTDYNLQPVATTQTVTARNPTTRAQPYSPTAIPLKSTDSQPANEPLPIKRGIGFLADLRNIKESEYSNNNQSTVESQTATASSTVRVQSPTQSAVKQPTNQFTTNQAVSLPDSHKTNTATALNLTKEKQRQLQQLQQLKEKAAQQAALLTQQKEQQQQAEAKAAEAALLAEQQKQVAAQQAISEKQAEAEQAARSQREAVYQLFKKGLKGELDLHEELKPNYRSAKSFLANKLDDLNIKGIQSLVDDFLERAKEEGVIQLNPNYKEGNRKPKYLKA